MTDLHRSFSLRADGVELTIDVSGGFPHLVHWGRDTGADGVPTALASRAVPGSGLDDGVAPSILREAGRGAHGRPALRGHRDGRDWSPLFTVRDARTDADSLTIELEAGPERLEATIRYTLAPQGVLLVDSSVTNLAEAPYVLDELLSWLPVPAHATEAIDFTGRWLKERQLQRHPIAVGTWSRDAREGRSGHDHTIVQFAVTAGAGFRSGEVWGAGLAWSGNSRHLIERAPAGETFVGAGELLEPGEVVLGGGESYDAPRVVAVYSSDGIDGAGDRLHRWLRARPHHPSSPRPLTLNVWEAVYFDHSFERIAALVDVAADIGVERFVLDDGWFGTRRNDQTGLGDWVVSADAWPDGLGPLIDRVEAAGMEFGLWFEGEMVNPDSDVFRAHPEWILHLEGRTPPLGRSQHVLDLTHPDAYAHVLGHVDAVLSEYRIGYIKWDHNRTLVDAAHDGRPAARRQTLALYRLFDELKRRHPGLEIESCASGGGRVDLGMVDHVDRFWTSDSNDAYERQQIQRYTGIAIPPELLGTHIGPTVSHTSGRRHSLPFRAITALFGHAGLEWDITETTPEEREHLRSWADYYKTNRALLHSGRVVRADQVEPSALVHGVVAHDGTSALFAYVQLQPSGFTAPVAVSLPGLRPERTYRVRLVEPAGPARRLERAAPAWQSGITTTGAALAAHGVEPPLLMPEEAVLIEAVAVG